MERILSLIKDNSIDLIIIDVPYGINYKTDIYNDSTDYVLDKADVWLELLSKKLKPTCHCYIFIPTTIMDIWMTKIRKYFTLNNVVTVDVYYNSKQNPKLNNNFTYTSQHVIYCSKGKAKNFNNVNIYRYTNGWLKDKRNKNDEKKEVGYRYIYPNFIDHVHGRANEKRNQVLKNIHPNQKNLKLIENFIKLSSNKGDIVLDSFMGSGTTILAAILNNRYAIGIDSMKYKNFLKSEKRIKDDYKKMKIKKEKSYVNLLEC
jgi:DNA modification methylase